MTKKKEVVETKSVVPQEVKADSDDSLAQPPKEESKTFNIDNPVKLNQVILGLQSAKLEYTLEASFLTVSGKALVLVKKMLG